MEQWLGVRVPKKNRASHDLPHEFDSCNRNAHLD